MRTLGSPFCKLWVLEDNVRARRFYERRGWRENGEARVVESSRRTRSTSATPSTSRLALMTRVRFRTGGPTGSLHVGNALSAVANRDFGDWLLLRIDDTDAARNVPGGEEAIRADLEWLGVEWDEGPVRQSERAERHREAADAARRDRFDGSHAPPRGRIADLPARERRRRHRLRDHARRPRERPPAERGSCTGGLLAALGAEPPEYVHHGLILGEDGQEALEARRGARRSRRCGTRAFPPEAVRALSRGARLPKHDVHYDLPRIRRLAIEAIGAMTDEELAARVGAPVEVVPALRGARDLERGARLRRVRSRARACRRSARTLADARAVHGAERERRPTRRTSSAS